MKEFLPPKLPRTDLDLESKTVLKALVESNKYIAELKGYALSIPNQNILINSLGLQEAKDSSEIENIITTHDDLYIDELEFDNSQSPQAKEVKSYISAMKRGVYLLDQNDIITSNTMLQIQEAIEQNNAGFRKQPGTSLKNQSTGEIIYTPPQKNKDILDLLKNLEQYINEDLDDLDPIVRMALIHYQFESIHPFYDGNGRTGRIINILYLIKSDLLNAPILYLSNYIIKHKSRYYSLLGDLHKGKNWEEWILFFANGITITAKNTIEVIKKIKTLFLEFKHRLRNNYKFYSQDLLNNVFVHPYTKIEFVERDLGVSRVTASNYLNKLASDGVLEKRKLGPANYYVNKELFAIISSI